MLSNSGGHAAGDDSCTFSLCNMPSSLMMLSVAQCIQKKRMSTSCSCPTLTHTGCTTFRKACCQHSIQTSMPTREKMRQHHHWGLAHPCLLLSSLAMNQFPRRFLQQVWCVVQVTTCCHARPQQLFSLECVIGAYLYMISHPLQTRLMPATQHHAADKRYIICTLSTSAVIPGKVFRRFFLLCVLCVGFRKRPAMTQFAFSKLCQGRVATCKNLTKGYLHSSGMHAVDVVDTGSNWMLKASHHEL